MRLYGEGLCYEGDRVLINTRFVESTRADDIKADVPDEYEYTSFIYDIYCGILQIQTADILKVYPYKYWHVEEHHHAYYELHIIPRGRGRIVLDGVSFEVGPGQFYLTGPYAYHEQFADEADPMEEYCIQFSIKISDTLSPERTGYQSELNTYRSILGTSYPRAFRDQLGLNKTFDLMFEEVEQGQVAYELRVHTLVTEILIGAMRIIQNAVGSALRRTEDTDEFDRRALVIRNFVEANYSEKISIHDLSNILFLSDKQINRIMLRAEGTTFQSYLQRHRYLAAKTMIADTALPLDEIAKRTGLTDESHLHKLFHKYDAASPGSYR